MNEENTRSNLPSQGQSASLSYKFQRLREQIRTAIKTGELSGKLPGERELARRFGANAKTLGKALTDLAAEGLLVRSIGRGTYVRTEDEEAATTPNSAWLIVSGMLPHERPMLDCLLDANPDARVYTEHRRPRPSTLAAISAVLDLRLHPDPEFYRDLRVRGTPLVRLAPADHDMIVHQTWIDLEYAGFLLGKRLLLSGVRKLGAISPPGRTELFAGMRTAIQRYAPDATIDLAYAQDLTALINSGVHAIVCDCSDPSLRAKDITESLNSSTQILGAGVTDQPVCSGYFVSPSKLLENVQALLKDYQGHKPVTLPMSGRFIEVSARAEVGVPDTATLTQEEDATQP